MESKYMFKNGHPHAGELATPAIEQRVKMIGDIPMFPWKIVDCKHGTDWCYAEKDQVVKVCQEVNNARV